jgi:GT2 family glycosyltransferase
VRVIRGQWGSAGAARNAGWRAARGAWVAFLDADDLWFDEKLASAESLLTRFPGAGWFFSDGAFRTTDGQLRTSWTSDWARIPEPYHGHPLEALLQVNFILTSSVVVKRELLESCGGFDESMTHAEDVDLWIRLTRRAPAVATARSLVRYQHLPGGLTRSTVERLEGNARLYERLGRDPDLPAAMRRLARRRAASSRLKLGRVALKRHDGRAARRHLARAWSGGRAPAVAAAWALSLLPPAVSDWLRGNPWIRERVTAPALATTPVMLVSEPPPTATITETPRPHAGGESR